LAAADALGVTTRRRSGGAGLTLALFVFVGLMAMFMGAAAVAPSMDRTNRIIAICLFVPLAWSTVLFAFALRRALFGRWLTDRRWRGYRTELTELGFSDAHEGTVQETQRLPVHILFPAVLASQRGGGIDHVMVGSINGHEARAFDIRVRGGGWFDAPAVALRLPIAMAPTMIRPARGRFKLQPRPGMRSVLLESERFNRSTAVFSTDQYFATSLLDARMMEWLMEHGQRCVIELSDRWMAVWALPRSGKHLGPIELLGVLEAMEPQLPRVVPSLFPEHGEGRLWKSRSR
jgi:hypothetical protein